VPFCVCSPVCQSVCQQDISTFLNTNTVRAYGREEGGDVGRADGRVDAQDQYQPVPDGLERRVVEYCPTVMTRHLQLVLRQHVLILQRSHELYSCVFLLPALFNRRLFPESTPLGWAL